MKMLPQLLSLDIQVEIIKRLPVKSLIQFRSVCKAWNSLIDSSQFIVGYDVPHDQPQQLIIRYEVGEENEDKYVCFVDDDTFPQQKVFLTIPHLAREAIVIDGSHGLLCLKHFQREPGGSYPTFAVLWNPSIRKSIGVVLPNDVHPPIHSVIAFGVCPDTKDPKIVYLTYIDGYEKPSKVMVFTLSSGEWRCLSSNHWPRKSIQFVGIQVVIGRFIYWLAYDGNYKDDEFHNLILSFDLSTDEFRKVELPHNLRQLDLSISRVGESLVLLDYYNTNTTDKQVCYVWMMEDGDKKVFTKLFTIKPPHASVSWTQGFRNNGEPIIGMRDDDEDIFSECALVVYKPCLEHIKDLGIRGPMNSFYGGSYTYTESLLLLNHDDGHIIECGAVKR